MLGRVLSNFLIFLTKKGLQLRLRSNWEMSNSIVEGCPVYGVCKLTRITPIMQMAAYAIFGIAEYICTCSRTNRSMVVTAVLTCTVA